jgi:hypothetical protein
VKIIHFKTL